MSDEKVRLALRVHDEVNNPRFKVTSGRMSSSD
jgi:hypothetical protein